MPRSLWLPNLLSRCALKHIAETDDDIKECANPYHALRHVPRNCAALDEEDSFDLKNDGPLCEKDARAVKDNEEIGPLIL